MENEVIMLKIKGCAGLAGFDMDKSQRKELNRVPFFVIPKRSLWFRSKDCRFCVNL